MPTDQNLRAITIEGGRTVYINVRDIRSFYNFESKLTIEMIDGTVYNVDGAPNVSTFYTSTFGLDPREVTVTNNPLEAHLTNNPLNTFITNSPLDVQEHLQGLSFTTTTVSVTTASTLLLAANPDRKLLIVQRGNTIGSCHIKLGSGAATTSNGILLRENTIFTLDRRHIYTGEINAIAVATTKTVIVTEGV